MSGSLPRVFVLLTCLAAASACAAPVTGSGDSADVRIDAAPESSSDAPGDLTNDLGLDALMPCTDDGTCSDGVFCNGVERCMPGATGADLRGCVPANPTTPCAPPQTCNEAMQRCETGCATTADADGDGHRTVACGGDDCDDGNPNRFPGNPEVCDAANLDEDCDPATFGSRDADADGYVDSRCCNAAGAGTNCGDDCNDARADMHPTLVEICDTFDNDCNGTADDGVLTTFFRDVDGDGYGVDSMSITGCSAPAGYAVLGGDCDDTLRGINPSASDICNGIEDDCIAPRDPGCSCVDGMTQPCGPSQAGTGDCRAGVATCLLGVWPSTCVGAVYPGIEVCGGGDEDCDGAIDESTASDATTWYRDADGDGYGNPAISQRACVMPSGYVAGRTDCRDSDALVHPGAAERCNGVDDDCNGAVPSNEMDSDGDGYRRCANDCNDNSANVHPGQTAYFEAGVCPSGATVTCGATTCLACSLGTASWDYDCSGTAVRERHETCASYGSTSCLSVNCAAQSGAAYNTTTAMCGRLVANSVTCTCSTTRGPCVGTNGVLRHLACH